MKGYELIQKITDGKLATGTKIKVKIGSEYTAIITYENFGLKWETGKFDTSVLCSKHAEFELIEENKEIEELDRSSEGTAGEFNSIKNKINELVRAVNKLTKKEGKNEII